jgi:hypothetical protein
MSVIDCLRVPSLAVLVLVLPTGAASVAQAAAPDSCRFLTPASVSAAIGRPVTGGTISVVDSEAATASSCVYMAGTLFISLRVEQLATGPAAQKEFAEQLSNERGRDEDNRGGHTSQKTSEEAGRGDAAFSSAFTDGSMLEFTAVRAERLVQIGIVGDGAAGVSHERLRGLMQAALTH